MRTLARLWQLQVKMQSVGGGNTSAYEARIERVAAARASLEQRLAKRLELLDGYVSVKTPSGQDHESRHCLLVVCLHFLPGTCCTGSSPCEHALLFAPLSMSESLKAISFAHREGNLAGMTDLCASLVRLPVLAVVQPGLVTGCQLCNQLLWRV